VTVIVVGIGEDVSEKKDGGVIRSQLRKGDGYMMPKEGASCEGIISRSTLILLANCVTSIRCCAKHISTHVAKKLMNF